MTEQRNCSLSRGERVIVARLLMCENPKDIQLDDEMLPWIFDAEQELWFGLDGRYSQFSPVEKRKRELDREEVARRMADEILLWSIIRLEVLKRDDYSCQLCGLAGDTRLHVHHILKKVAGGTDHTDNLITVCPKCHSAADRGLYNPDWSAKPSIPIGMAA